MENVLDKCLTPTTEMIMNLMEIENANINTNHPDFVGSADSLLNLFQDDQSQLAQDTNNDDNSVLEPDDEKEKTYTLLSKRKQVHDELSFFENVEDIKHLSANKANNNESKLKETEKQLAMSQINLQHENSELKNSMYQNVFGYNPNQQKHEETKVKHVKFNTGFMSQPDFSNSGFSN